MKTSRSTLLLAFISLFCLKGGNADASDPAGHGLTRQLYSGISGANVGNLTSAPTFPNAPNSTEVKATAFRMPADAAGSTDEADNYGQRWTGYIVAPASGDYEFWVGSRHSAQLFLSPTTEPTQKVLVASNGRPNALDPITKLPVWLSNDTSSSRSTNNSFVFNGGAPGVITLKAGRAYYVELLHKAATGDDFFAAGWTKPGDVRSETSPAEVIPLKWLMPQLSTTPNLVQDSYKKASRFLGQATFGARQQDIDALGVDIAVRGDLAISDWINAQIGMPITDSDHALPSFRKALVPNYPDTSGFYPNDAFGAHGDDAAAFRTAAMVDSPHQLRERVAYALSEIFVVSMNSKIGGDSEGYCDWWDLLFDQAFGTYTDLLTKVTNHPVMGFYLSSERSTKTGFRGDFSIHPDENYAREVMQLFSIGLLKLNKDGSFAKIQGQIQPTYNNTDITENARVITGFWSTDASTAEIRDSTVNPVQWHTGIAGVNYLPMSVLSARHDTDSKVLLSLSGSVTVPAGNTQQQDVNTLISLLASHKNTAPFLARAMIQQLVTSNPSPAYISTVSDAFITSGGNLGAMVKAILMNPEALLATNATGEKYGKLKEPWMRLLNLARAFPAQPQQIPNKPYLKYFAYPKGLNPLLGQYPLNAPSVFNFFLPTYESPGAVADRNAGLGVGDTRLVAPEFQIMNSNTAFRTINCFSDTIYYLGGQTYYYKPFVLNINAQKSLAADADLLLDNVDLLLTHGMMSSTTRAIIRDAVNALPATGDDALTERARLAIYLISVSPDFAIQK